MKNLAFCLLLLLLFSCEGIRLKKSTPKAFLNHSVPPKEVYSRDTAVIRENLRQALYARVDFFKNSAYTDSTRILIDTIIYNNDFTKLVVFVMTQNPTSRQLMPDPSSDYYFDGTSYMGIRKKNIVLEHLGPNFTNSNSRPKLSEMMRESYFTDFASDDSTLKYPTPYNVNDTRFWNTSIWEKFSIGQN
jgi:hypothetical protein